MTEIGRAARGERGSAERDGCGLLARGGCLWAGGQRRRSHGCDAAARGRSGASRLGAAAAALAAALLLALAAAGAAVAAGASVGPDAPPLAGGSAVGILLDGTPDPDDDRQSGDSHLGLLLAADGRVPEAVFMSQGVEVERVSVPFGTAIPEPARPTWDWGRPALFGFSQDSDPPARPVFAGWCLAEDEAWPGRGAGAAYAFGEPATELTYAFYAAWEDSSGNADDLLAVQLDAGEGASVPRASDPVTGETVDSAAAGGAVLHRRAGQPYRWLPVPERRGYVFQGWSTDQAHPGGVPYVSADTLVARTAEGNNAVVLYAQWAPMRYTVVYIDRPDGHGSKVEQAVTFGAATTMFTWQEACEAAAASGGALSNPTGKQFAGWADVRNYDGKNGRWFAGAGADDMGALAEGLALRDGMRVALYAQWDDAPLEESYAVRLHYNDGAPDDPDDAGRVVELDVATGTTVAACEGYEAPKRAGYQFAGWHADEGLAEDSAWDVEADPVRSELDLWAAWTLRLDVTVPVSVAFAVDAATRAVTAPDADAYAIKSRTVVPVAVKAFALESRDDELAAFFEVAGDGDDGTASEGADAGAAAGATWDDGVAETELSLKSEKAAAPIALSLAGEQKEVSAASGDYALGAFSYGALADDAAWAGAEPCRRLAIAFGMDISPQLKVKVGHEGAVPIAHVKVTVMAKG